MDWTFPPRCLGQLWLSGVPANACQPARVNSVVCAIEHSALQENEHDPPDYYTPAIIAFATGIPMTRVGILIGEVFGISKKKGYGYPAAEIHLKFDELGAASS